MIQNVHLYYNDFKKLNFFFAHFILRAIELLSHGCNDYIGIGRIEDRALTLFSIHNQIKNIDSVFFVD